MVKLITLLKEIQNDNFPKAIFLSGPAGSGKSTIINKLVDISKFNILNIDDVYEELLKDLDIGTDQTKFGPEELSQAAKMMGKAQKVTKDKYEKSKENLQNIIIDGTGAASNPLLKKKQELEDLGYDTFMIALYVSPITALKRNLQRKRKLMPSIVLRTWRDYNKNLDLYREEFGNNFSLINTDDKDVPVEYNLDYIKKHFLDKYKVKGKPKTPEKEEKRKKEKEKINQDIKELIKISRDFDNIEDVKLKINKLL